MDNARIVLIAPPRTGYKSTETPVPRSYFSIHRPYIVRALHWLKDHNTPYRDIEIEEVSDDAPSSQTAVNEMHLMVKVNHLLLEEIYNFPNIEVSDVINNNEAPVHQLQRVQGDLISIYTTRVLMLNRWPICGCIWMALMGIKHHTIHP